MKNCFLLLLLLFLVQVIYSQSASKATSKDLPKLAWLQGTWNRLDTKPGRTAHESWTKKSDQEWQGLGVSLRGKDTAFVEKIGIVVKDDHLYYVADVQGNKQPVYFAFTAITENGFVCENAQHDFPKKIEYQQDGKKLKATISGDGKAMNFLFEKK